MDRFDRIFELNRILQTARRPVSRTRLETELECSRATVKRTIEDMRNFLNAPIRYDREYNGYYYDARDGEIYELPGLWFNASELHALLSVQQLLQNVQPGLLDGHLRPLRERIDKLLANQHASGQQFSRRIRILQIAARNPGSAFVPVAGAVADQRRLQLTHYNRRQNTTTKREVSPLRLTYYRDNWYLDAWCHLRADLRTFSLDAIAAARPLDKSCKKVSERQMDAHFGQAYGIFSGAPAAVARLRFTPEIARWVAHEQWHPEQQAVFNEDGSYELSIPYSQSAELVMDILRYGEQVEVLEPKELVQQVRGRLKAALDRYA